MGSCFSLGWIEQLCIWLVLIIAAVSIIRLVVPYLLNLIGVPLVGAIINIVLWAAVAIMVIYVIFGLLSCVLGFGPAFHRLG